MNSAHAVFTSVSGGEVGEVGGGGGGGDGVLIFLMEGGSTSDSARKAEYE